MNARGIWRETLRRSAAGFPWGAAGVYLLFLIGNLFTVPAPGGSSVTVVSGALAARWGNPVAAALAQFFWSGLLGAVLAPAGVPFLLDRGTVLWSGLHFLLTAAVLSLAGWRCGWFPSAGTWLCVLGLALLCYLLMWAVRCVGWRQDLQRLRRAAGLSPAPLPAEDGAAEPDAGKKPRASGKPLLPYLLLAAGVELALPWLLRAADAVDVPVLTGVFYPFLILPLFCFFSASAAGRRCGWRRTLLYAAACALLVLPNVFLLYNSSALFQAGMAGAAALLGGGLGILGGRKKNI